MNLNGMIRDLKAEREALATAIACLESVARGGQRRGRPPAWLKKGIRLVGQHGVKPREDVPDPVVGSHPDQSCVRVSAA